jgi:hypothetical protein
MTDQNELEKTEERSLRWSIYLGKITLGAHMKQFTENMGVNERT